MALFEKSNKSKLHDLEKIAQKVAIEREKVRGFTIEQIRKETEAFKSRLAGKSKEEQYKIMDEIMPRAYAIVIETIKQTFGFELKDTQVIGGIGLHHGYISEIATGEGKTITASLPSYLNALTGNGVQVITPNEYLASRDAEKMRKLYGALGLSVGVNLNSSSTEEKKKAYQCDIMYSTCSELGFDYLRDNMAYDKNARVRRENSFDSFLLIDEADSIMLDEANVPLVISANGNLDDKTKNNYIQAQKFVEGLDNLEFEIDEKDGTVTLTELGIKSAEEFYGIENISDEENLELMSYIKNALTANYLLQRNDEYVIVNSQNEVVDGYDPNGQIMLIDKNTQRKLKGRQLSKGLHQALQAKENLANITSESKTASKTTIQNFVSMYSHFAGMTGTAMTDVSEFNAMYQTDVINIPQKVNNRKDDPLDTVYKTKKEKIDAIIAKVKDCVKKGRPVLVGTITIEQSEELSRAFKEAGIEHQLLNATFSDNSEREIVAQAGRKGTVTIATDMAGRGTDIPLGGNNEFMAITQMKKEGFTPEQVKFATTPSASSRDITMIRARLRYTQLCNEYKLITAREKKEVMEAGGLHIIGTEKHTSRRVDNQLRGRAGRQGDVGSSEFIVSLEDEFIRVQDEEGTIKRTAESLGIGDNLPVRHPLLTKMIERYQIAFEGLTAGKRSDSAKFDNVLNEQRDNMYEMRNRILNNEFASQEGMMSILHTVVESMLKLTNGGNGSISPSKYESINERLETYLLPKGTNLVDKQYAKGDSNVRDLSQKIVASLREVYLDNIKQMSASLKKTLNLKIDEKDIYPFVEHSVIAMSTQFMLMKTNSNWSEHIEYMESLKQTCWLQSMAGKKPIDVYKEEGWKAMFELNVNTFESSCRVLTNKNLALSYILSQPKVKDQLVNYAKRVEQAKGVQLASE